MALFSIFGKWHDAHTSFCSSVKWMIGIFLIGRNILPRGQGRSGSFFFFFLKSFSTDCYFLSRSHGTTNPFSDISFRDGKIQFLFSIPQQVIVTPCLSKGDLIFGHFDVCSVPTKKPQATLLTAAPLLTQTYVFLGGGLLSLRMQGCLFCMLNIYLSC